MYATIDAGSASGIYRSDDAGERWSRIQTDNRQFDRGYDFGEIKVDPQNPDIVYTANVVTWKSMDGGRTWNAFRGAPGGDDYHRIWINPNQPSIILIASILCGTVKLSPTNFIAFAPSMALLRCVGATSKAR